MDNELLELLKYRYNRAVETLEVTQELFKNGKFKDANNRSYYAAYYVPGFRHWRQFLVLFRAIYAINLDIFFSEKWDQEKPAQAVQTCLNSWVL